jgi:hypothetical protein
MAAAPLTLLAFLSSGCSSCAAFWSALADQRQRRLLPSNVRVVAVSKGPEFESPDAIRAKAGGDVAVVMSTQAWSDYEVPGSPFFALIDGVSGRRAGEGVGHHFAQVAELIGRAAAEAGDRLGASTSRAAAAGLDGPAREQANDADLERAGIRPGDPSLYPRSLDEVFRSTAALAARPDGSSSPR